VRDGTFMGYARCESGEGGQAYEQAVRALLVSFSISSSFSSVMFFG
jgi:hypothetical protein